MALIYEEYLDQYQNEIALDLRRGNLTALGTELPNHDRDTAMKILEDCGEWAEDIEVTEIPPEYWISKDVVWDESALYGRVKSYIWIHFKTDEMINKYKPTDIIRGKEMLSLGDNFAMTSATVNGAATSRSRRGRPSFPWGTRLGGRPPCWAHQYQRGHLPLWPSWR